MRGGYLYLQTHSDHPDRVRVLDAEQAPATDDESSSVALLYIARFNDLDAAKMHFHNALRRKLVDIDAGLYRVTPLEAIATIEAEALRHQRVWLNPTLAASELQQIDALTAQRRRRQRISEMIWRGVGVIALLWLLLNMLSGLS